MRILIVEDERRVSELLKKSLETECYVVDICDDGEQGLQTALLNDYDLIVLDIMLPKMSGVEVCKKLRLKGKIVPILILSVRTEVFTKVELLNAGADDYLIKPYSFEELLARIQALLRRPHIFNAEIFTAGPLILDTRRHTLFINGSEIYLSRKEFTLLAYMMRNQGHVLSRGMLLEHVWDMNTDPFSNTIESHIMSLRKKIGLEANHKFIHTVSGRGYKFEAKAISKKG